MVAEHAAERAFASLSQQERSAHTAANPHSLFIERALANKYSTVFSVEREHLHGLNDQPAQEKVLWWDR